MDYIQLPLKYVYSKTLSQARTLVDKSLGSGYFYEHLSDVNNVWLCYDDDDLIAWATTSQKDEYAILKSLVIHQDYRRKGIGKRMTKLRLAFLKILGIKKVRSYAWVHKNGDCPSCKNLETLGFVTIEDRFNYYKTYCPDCGDECNCVARVLEKIL